ncbi:H-NS family nucleoid-associated regulatory protein [Paracoccus laeviglucosivorans]|uniref:DNA-binding protein H-NS n=1 Tax=Paracoccus laeviglucosivorans TaxID=1197861 RepID=A0A521ELJ8_9RHOB|nr:H-NS histone family protein [Paracoccus laeviglucosivorans]SMO84785.1 DNA-binding protein H-NS [Paracoccus laeviglucosivorans]
MNVDLDTLSLKELKSLKTQVDRAVDSFEARQKQKALEALKATAQEHGFNLKDLMDGDSLKKSGVAPKYAHPENPEQTWTGRGRKPLWIQEALDSGKSLDDLAI